MKKAIASVLVVVGMLLAPGPAVAGLHDSLGLGAFLCGLPGCSPILAV